jgi:hypothetical protein
MNSTEIHNSSIPQYCQRYINFKSLLLSRTNKGDCTPTHVRAGNTLMWKLGSTTPYNKKCITISNRVVTLQLKNRVMIIILTIFDFMKIKMPLWRATAHWHLLTQYCVLTHPKLWAVSYRMYFQQRYDWFYNQYTNYSNYPFQHYWWIILCTYTRHRLRWKNRSLTEIAELLSLITT